MADIHLATFYKKSDRTSTRLWISSPPIPRYEDAQSWIVWHANRDRHFIGVSNEDLSRLRWVIRNNDWTGNVLLVRLHPYKIIGSITFT